MDNRENREINILKSEEKFEAFKKGLSDKLVERLLNTPLKDFGFDMYSVCFTVIVPRGDEFPYGVKLHMEHQEARTGLDIDWDKVESDENPEVYEAYPAEMRVYIYTYNPDTPTDDNSVCLNRYARLLRNAAYNAPGDFTFKYDSKNNPETYEKLYKLYLDALASYKDRCKPVCKDYTKECWKLFDVISDY